MTKIPTPAPEKTPEPASPPPAPTAATGERQDPDLLAPVPTPSAHWPWAIVALALIGSVTFIAYHLISTPERATDSLHQALRKDLGDLYETVREAADRFARTAGDALKPDVTFRSSVFSSFRKLKGQGKLVVATIEVDVQVEKSSQKKLWNYLDLGETRTSMKVRNNKVQYYIPVEAIAEDIFHYDSATRTVQLRFPAPVIDQEVVDVQSNPEHYEIETDVGWARLRSYSGKQVEKEARESLRGEVLATAAHEEYLMLAQIKAEKAIRHLFREVIDSFADDVTVEILFARPAPVEIVPEESPIETTPAENTATPLETPPASE